MTGYAGPTDTPGVGKIVFAFVVTILIGVAAVWVLRRYMPRVVAVLPQLGARAAANSTLRVVSSRAVHPGLRLHVVEVEGSTLVVAESRAGVALTIIPARTTSATTSPDEAGR
ncbi:MAG TPA: flagellar biosynthetic protein FliO [Steroidobacteraceae bacterium]|nr:flagellar biosynthetic protein FliO [Steroidobacteraceae bacterium]